MKLAAVLAIGLLLSTGIPGLEAQDSAAVADTARNQDALRVFIDCNTDCDFDFFRQEITFVNHVRDRQVAQVHVLVTGQDTGGGGTEYTLRFIGLRQFAGVEDQLRYTGRQTDTEDEVREGLTQKLKLGLVRYVARLPMADDLDISYEASEENRTAQGQDDPWDYWVFTARVNGFVSGQSSARSRFLNGSISANRTTENWKHNLFVNGSSEKQTFEFESMPDIVGRSSSYSTGLLMVRSLSDHWSAGMSGSARSSTDENEDLTIRAAPAIEFDIYPYSESTKRQVTLLYQVGYRHADYTETTIFGKRSEGLFFNSLILSADVTQPWGSLNTSLEASSYLNDFSKNRLEVFAGLEVRLFRGLALNLFGDYERIRDQLSLSATGATPEEILLELKELKTSYTYDISVGLSYTFGSIYNNVVNPRFGALD